MRLARGGMAQAIASVTMAIFPDWNHMEHAYAPVLEAPVVADAWKHGPVQMEVCGYIHEWYERGSTSIGFSVKGLGGMSVLNAKSKPVPAAWRPRINEFPETNRVSIGAGGTHPSRRSRAGENGAPVTLGEQRAWRLSIMRGRSPIGYDPARAKSSRSGRAPLI